MAKSKSGGTRSYLRGRIANDVYSIGKDANGKKQQVVRSLAESVANPQTLSQMRGRMIMATVMQAVSGLSPIIDHSFDDVPNGQPSISEFIRRNYALIKADVAAHPAGSNKFGLNEYQVKGARPGNYVISAGAVIVPSTLKYQTNGGGDVIPGTFVLPAIAEGLTAKDVWDAMGLGANDYLTNVTIDNAPNFGQNVTFIRIRRASDVAESLAVTAENYGTLFAFENPFGVKAEVSADGETPLLFAGSIYAETGAFILSKAVEGGYEHNTAVMTGDGDYENTADVALPTYPLGQERFLNGGEL